jgi:hypothetical protein
VTDLQLFRGLTKLIPLEPIADAETYFKACDIQDEYRDNPDHGVQLYFRALTVFVEAYENGYRPE